jgi:hypothetical protein
MLFAYSPGIYNPLMQKYTTHVVKSRFTVMEKRRENQPDRRVIHARATLNLKQYRLRVHVIDAIA